MGNIQSKNVRMSFILALLMVIYLYFHHALMTQSDYFLAFFILSNWILLALVIFSIRSGLRAIVKDLFQEDTLPYRWFTKNGMFQVFVTILTSLIFSLGFVVITKMVTLQHGIVVVAIAVLIAGWVTGLFRTQNHNENSVIFMKNHESRATLSRVLAIFTTVIMFTVVIAAVTSAKDTHMFFVNGASFGNFAELAAERSINYTGSNTTGRALVNLSLILEAFRQASFNELLDALSIEKNSSKYFWIFVLIFIGNFFKFISFSVAFVLITLSAKETILDTIALRFGLVFTAISSKVTTFRQNRKAVERTDSLTTNKLVGRGKDHA